MFRVDCHAPGCPCYAVVWINRWDWQAVRATMLSEGWVMDTEVDGPHYCACDHTQDGSRDPR